MSSKTRVLIRALAVAAALAAIAVVRPEGARAQDAAPAARTALEFDLAAASNPDGLRATLGAYRRWTSDGGSASPSSPYRLAGLSLAATPAYARGTIHGEWMPHPAVQLFAQLAQYRYFGANAALLSFENGDAAFGDPEVDDREGSEEAAWGQRALARSTLRMPLGPILLRNQTDLAWFRFDGRGPYFLEWEYDTLLKDGDWLVADTIQALLNPWKGAAGASLHAGPFFEIARAGASRITQERAGLVVLWTGAERAGSLRRPRVYGQAGVHLRDPNREGEAFLTLGLGFDLDLGR